jgi:branched-chain amino acid transport system substrate-binding protein
VACGLITFALPACTSSGNVAPPSTPEPTETTEAPRVDDGILRIGVLLPASGEGASIGTSELAGVRVAVDAANEAGGVKGKNVELIVRNEGADAVAAGVALGQLLEAQIDVMIGPAASNNAIALAPAIVQAGIAACSPSASALALDDFPDNGLLFRTIPSDSVQADAMAEVIDQTGVTSAAIVYIDDGYGRPFEEALEAALRRRGITVDDAIGYSADDQQFDSQADRIAKGPTGAVALIGDPDAGERVLAALAAVMVAAPRDIVVNDALRQPFSIGLLAAISDDVRKHIKGVSPYVRTDDKDLLAAITDEDSTASGLFATQAYDCANLFMIAAQQTGSTSADRLKLVIPGNSSAGSACLLFVSCKELLAQGRRINYVGPSSGLTLGSSGDPSSAIYDEFTFDDSGRDVSVRPIEAND